MAAPARLRHDQARAPRGIASSECSQVSRSGPGHTDHTTVRQVQALATGEQPLLTHRVPVVPWHTDIRPVSATTALIVASALPSILFFPYVCHRRNVPDDLLIALNPEEIRRSLPGTHPSWCGRHRAEDQRHLATNLEDHCHRAAGWPADAEVILRLPVRRHARQGAAIDLVLDRARREPLAIRDHQAAVEK